MTEFGTSCVKYWHSYTLVIIIITVIVNTNTAAITTIVEGILGIIVVNTEK
jgi:hypothetical protein